MQSLVLTVPQLHWEEEGEPEDTVDQMLGRALTYLVLFSTLGMFLRWSVGAKLLSTVEDAADKPQARTPGIQGGYRDDPHQQQHGEQPRTARLVDYEDDAQNAAPEIHIRRPTEDAVHDRPPPEPLTDGGRPPVRRSSTGRSGPPAWTRSFPNSPASPPDSRGESLLDENEYEERRRDPERQARTSGPSALQKVKTTLAFAATTLVVRPALAVNAFMTAPLWAAVLSLVVALISPLQTFIDSLEPVVGALQTSGACSIPLTMVVLGAYFVEDKSAADEVKASPPSQQPPAQPQPPVLPGGSRRAESPDGIADRDSDRQPWGVASEAPSTNESTGSLSWMKNPWSSENSAPNGSAAAAAAQRATSRSPSAASNLGATQNAQQKTSASSESRQETKTIAVSIASRMIVTPLILIPALAWYAVATRYNVMDDPVMIVSACLIIGSPPALTLAQITSQKANGNPQFERLISRTICECVRQVSTGHGCPEPTDSYSSALSNPCSRIVRIPRRSDDDSSRPRCAPRCGKRPLASAWLRLVSRFGVYTAIQYKVRMHEESQALHGEH